MKILLLGYGSLINLESASKTLKRELSKKDAAIGLLHGYERSWTLWDDVFSVDLAKQVKAVFLNVIPNEKAFLNGIFIEISNNELEYLKIREKNYDCIEITKRVTLDKQSHSNLKIFTFSGKVENLVGPNTDDFFIFDRYIEIINTGIREFGENFTSVFTHTTKPSNLPKLSGLYTFINSSQQNAR